MFFLFVSFLCFFVSLFLCFFSSLLQLHLAMGTLVVFYHIQHTSFPFPKTADGKILHTIELQSILVLLTMTWIAVFFAVNECTGADDTACHVFTLLLGLVVVCMNVLFLLKALWFTAKKFEEKEHLVNKMRTGFRKFRKRMSRSTTTSFESLNARGGSSTGGQKNAGRTKKETKKGVKKGAKKGTTKGRQQRKRWSNNPAATELEQRGGKRGNTSRGGKNGGNDVGDEGERKVQGKKKTMYYSNQLFHQQAATKYYDETVGKYYWHDPRTGNVWWEDNEEEKSSDEDHSSTHESDSADSDSSSSGSENENVNL